LKDGLAGIFDELIVRIKNNVGLWEIFSVELDWNTTAECAGSGTGQNISEYISNNKQQVFIDATDLLKEVTCDDEPAPARRGVYNFSIWVYANPILPNGSLDTTRSQYIKKYPAYIKL